MVSFQVFGFREEFEGRLTTSSAASLSSSAMFCVMRLACPPRSVSALLFVVASAADIVASLASGRTHPLLNGSSDEGPRRPFGMTSRNKQKFAKRGGGKARSQAGRSGGLVQRRFAPCSRIQTVPLNPSAIGLSPASKKLRTFQRGGKTTLAEIESTLALARALLSLVT
jgi:hypothetical protein